MEFEKMSKEELINYIKNIENTETSSGNFGLVWEKEKEPEKIVENCDKYLPILKNIENYNINNNKPINNMLIEGDNFHSLTVLNYTHKDSIDIIYIDPPYNTGKDDFKYNDNYVDIENEYRHSKWLNFMNKRLKLAKELLKNDGIIFISIDNNEFAQLKLLCDKVFGYKSFITVIHVEMSITQGLKVGAAKQGNIVKNGEYILVYRKNGQNNIGITPLLDPVKYDRHYNLFIEKKNNYFEESKLIDKISEEKDIIEELKILKIANKNGKISNNQLPDSYEKSSKFREWVNSHSENICRAHDSIDVPEKIKNEYTIGRIYEYESDSRKYYVCKDSKGNISQRILLSEKLAIADDLNKTYGPTKIRGDWWSGFYLDMGNVSKEGKVNFKNGKKPVRLIKQLLKLTSKKDDVILDFFAGSGTTGQAVMELNREDGGTRQYILCTNNEVGEEKEKEFKKKNKLNDVNFKKIKENNDKKWKDWQLEFGICTSITYPRLKNVILDENNSTNLKYYKTEFIENSNNRDQLYFDLTEKCIPMLCIKENTFIQVIKTDEFMIYRNYDDTKYTCVYFDLFGNYESFIEKVKNINQEKKMYIFSLGDYVDEKKFNSINNYSIEPIPYKIVELYRTLAKYSKEK